jgi:2,3,4,5-tetrahydropyridine-2-carboxylate N-succinyltransferase
MKGHAVSATDDASGSTIQASRAIGLGLGTRDEDGWLEVLFPHPCLGLAEAAVATLAEAAGASADESFDVSSGSLQPLLDALRGEGAEEAVAAIERSLADLCLEAGQLAEHSWVLTLLDTQAPPQSVPQAYLGLQLLSQRMTLPNSLNLEGIFSLLPNVAWTSEGPMRPEAVNARIAALRKQRRMLLVHAVDKYPPMTSYFVPSGVRIGDCGRVRLGAHLGSGTTVMHEGFVNFNAGTEGPNMVEGRISAGVMVHGGADLGGGCSTMGTLSGGGRERIVIGRDCLIGANAGTGIPLGDRCTIEAGLYVTAGIKVIVHEPEGPVVRKALELAGQSDLLFRRNSQTGAVECWRTAATAKLNTELHANN